MTASLKETGAGALEEFLALPETTRAELIDGTIYYTASPSRRHQEIVSELHGRIYQFLNSKNAPCRVYPAPFSVKADRNKDNYLEPDLSVVCDRNKLTDSGCEGAPDWIIEVASPSGLAHDYIVKLSLYREAGVREYWIVNPMEKAVLDYHLEEADFGVHTYTFADSVPSRVFPELTIDFAEIDRVLEDGGATTPLSVP